jgi:hypothetical protein
MKSIPKSCRLLAAMSLTGALMLAAALPAGASTGTPSDEQQPNPIMCFLTGGGQACFGEGGGGGGEKQPEPKVTPYDEGPKPNPGPIQCVIQGGQNCFGQGGGGEEGGGEGGGGGSGDGPQSSAAQEEPQNPIMCVIQGGGEACFGEGGGGGGEKEPTPKY